MNTRKFIVSSVAALSIVGSIGLAYAQTTGEQGASGSAAATPSGRVEGTTNASTTDPTLSPNARTPSAPSNTMDPSSSQLPARADRG